MRCAERRTSSAFAQGAAAFAKAARRNVGAKIARAAAACMEAPPVAAPYDASRVRFEIQRGLQILSHNCSNRVREARAPAASWSRESILAHFAAEGFTQHDNGKNL